MEKNKNSFVFRDIKFTPARQLSNTEIMDIVDAERLNMNYKPIDGWSTEEFYAKANESNGDTYDSYYVDNVEVFIIPTGLALLLPPN